jgi:hypothetical protein
MTPRQESVLRARERAHAIFKYWDIAMTESDSKQLSIVWEVMTSRGSEKFIYGPEPGLEQENST